MQVFFSSQDGGDRLRACVIETLDEALAVGASRPVDVHVMTFSFTDGRIATALADAAARHPNVTIRIIADWAQGSGGAGRQARDLVKAGLPNLLVRFTKDQPYRWDAATGRMRWSYRTSRGLLHHKTLSIRIAGEPWTLVCGSFNWTARAADSYENVLIVSAGQDGPELLQAVECEFHAMWCDGRLTLSTDEARTHYFRILEEYRCDPLRPPVSIVGLPAGRDTTIGSARDIGDRGPTSHPHLATGGSTMEGATRLAIAFSSRPSEEMTGTRGYSPWNRSRRFLLHKPSGRLKEVPLTITALALDVIGRAVRGDTLDVAMYALSARVPEYGALLEAARRGVRIRILLDRQIGGAVIAQLTALLAREDLPIEVRAGSRMMHQKYIVHPRCHTVLTGTANMTTDASGRHAEQRILIRDDPGLTARFLRDFETIWMRLPPGGPAHAGVPAVGHVEPLG